MTGCEVREVREQLGLNKSQWALILNVTYQTIHRWEAENTRSEPTGTARAVLAAIKVALDEGVPVDRVRARLAMGIGTLIHTALTEATQWAKHTSRRKTD